MVFGFRKVRKPKTRDREPERLEGQGGLGRERETALNKQLFSATNRSHFTEQMSAALHVLISSHVLRYTLKSVSFA